jgi:hypothetical protein
VTLAREHGELEDNTKCCTESHPSLKTIRQGCQHVDATPLVSPSPRIIAEGHKFEDVDLSEEWADYDDTHDISVSIMSVEHRFVVQK